MIPAERLRRLLVAAAVAVATTLSGTAVAVTTPAEAAALPLAGQVVVLDPGHDGGNASHPSIVSRLVYAGGGVYKPCNTSGTSTNAGYAEHAFTWSVARRVRTILEARGAVVVLTRSSDTGVGPCVNTRAAIGNRVRADAVVSIHADGARSTGHGFHVIQPATSLAGAGGVRASHRLALAVRARVKSESGLSYATYTAGGDGLVTRGDLGGLNLSRRPSIFIECANMRNRSDAGIVSGRSGRARIARAVADGITDYLS
jgi:N-acetylmuramoyl-L-alanine amidase